MLYLSVMASKCLEFNRIIVCCRSDFRGLGHVNFFSDNTYFGGKLLKLINMNGSVALRN